MKTEDIFTCTVLTPPKTETENCLPVGTHLADFEITGILGEGGFGIVYIAFDHSLQRTIAIKEYMPSSLAGRGADGSIAARSQRQKETFNAGLRSFINEARLLAQFDHPSLVKVYRFWEENKTAYMAMRYYEGHTLKNIISENPGIVTEAWLRFIFKQILEALDVLYKMKILHRDISPDNIIVQKNGSAVLLDFGAARQIIGDMTQGLTVILKPGYAPIEQYADDAAMKQGPWTDIYSLSAVMYLAVAKTPPPSSVARMVSDTIAPLQETIHPKFSAKFLSAIEKGMSVQPEGRPQSIAEFRKLLSIGTFNAQVPAPLNPLPDDKSNRRAPAIESSKSITADDRTKKNGPRREPLKEAASNLPNPSTLTKRPALLVAGVLFLAAALGIFLYSRLEPTSTTPLALPSASVIAHTPEVNLHVAPVEQPDLSSDKESIAWNTLSKNPNATPAQLDNFIAEYPSGKHAQQAKARLNEIHPTVESQASSAILAEATTTTLPATDTAITVAIKLAVKPWGTIFIDGKQKGVTPPLKKIILSEGKHKIRISNPNFADYSTEINVSKKKLAVIEHDFSSP